VAPAATSRSSRTHALGEGQPIDGVFTLRRWCSRATASYPCSVERDPSEPRSLLAAQIETEIRSSWDLIDGARVRLRDQRCYAGAATRRARDQSARLVNGWAGVRGLPLTSGGSTDAEVHALILDTARRLFDDCGSISLTTVDQLGGDRLDCATVASTGIAESVDELQYQLGEGPCIDAVELDLIGAIRSNDPRPAGAATCWPRFTEAAARLGVHSFMSISVPWTPLRVGLPAGRRALGSINLYARGAHAFGEADVRAEMFGCWAGSMLSGQEPVALYHEGV
jgi:hypothetical protein